MVTALLGQLVTLSPRRLAEQRLGCFILDFDSDAEYDHDKQVKFGVIWNLSNIPIRLWKLIGALGLIFGAANSRQAPEDLK
jgi:hypothetical protein